MTLTTLIIRIAIVAILLTVFSYVIDRSQKNNLENKKWIVDYNHLMSFLQYFTGVLFVFSGWVKAVDPLGTAYKMEQYFSEFESTFEATWFSFIAPMFPFLSNYAIGFSVFMIVFEIILGVMLVLGTRPKFTSWAFLLLVVFFTFLTGFTYLTGYVPDGINFFSFGNWGDYAEKNMKVTDCGCFGDFIKLEPRTSFLKDIFLLIPAFYFLFFYKNMHSWISGRSRDLLTITTGILTFLFCISNYVWDLPITDFRPFKEGVDIKKQKEIEENAMANVAIIGWEFENSNTGEIVKVMEPNYMEAIKNYQKNDGWQVKDQVKTAPAIKPSKISDFSLKDLNDNEMTDSFLDKDGYSFLLVCHKLYGDSKMTEKTVQDTIYNIDTILITENGMERLTFKKTIQKIEPKVMKQIDVEWENDYLERFINIAAPLTQKAKSKGVPSYLIAGGATPAELQDLIQDTGLKVIPGTADDILLKTIVRSNPGFVLMKNGQIVKKWHFKTLPPFEEILSKHIQN